MKIANLHVSHGHSLQINHHFSSKAFLLHDVRGLNVPVLKLPVSSIPLLLRLIAKWTLNLQRRCLLIIQLIHLAILTEASSFASS